MTEHRDIILYLGPSSYKNYAYKARTDMPIGKIAIAYADRFGIDFRTIALFKGDQFINPYTKVETFNNNDFLQVRIVNN